MKQLLLLLLVFAAAFAATFLFTRDAFRPVRIADEDDVAGDAAARDALDRRRRAEIERSMISGGAPDAAPGGAVEVGAAATPTVGEIEGLVRTDDGVLPAGLVIGVYPAGPEVKLLGGGRFRLEGLAPASYVLGVSAEGYLAKGPVEVEVAAGKKYGGVELWLEKGFVIAGIVVEDTDQRPIQGARIDFNGMGEATSDARGTFRTGFVSPKALDVVTLTHDDFDRNEIIRSPFPDPGQVTLAMSRGKGTVTGRVRWPAGREAPGGFRVRVWRFVMENHEQLRRDRVFRDTAEFEIRGVFDGTNILEVSFPGTTLASRRIEFDLDRKPALHVDVDVNDGGTVEGTFTLPSNLVASQALMLVDAGNRTIGETVTDAEGKFRFEFVPAGRYAIRMDARVPRLFTESFEVMAFKPTSIVVDGALGRLR